MLKRMVIALIISSAIVATTLTCHAQTYDEMPDGYTFTVQEIGTYTYDPRADATKSRKATNKFAEETDISNYENKVIALTNREREKCDLPPLEVDDTLTAIAQQRAEELLQSFSHIRPDGTPPITIFDDYGCDLDFMAENIAHGQKTPQKVVNA